MDLDMHQAIAGKLEAGKLAGWLSEYLVAWHGPSDQLEPEVTVWRAPDQNDDTIKAYLSGLSERSRPGARHRDRRVTGRSLHLAAAGSYMLGTAPRMHMTAPLKSIEGSGIAAAMADIGRRAKAAARTLALSPAAQRDKALAAMAQSIRDSEAGILAANAEDVAEAKAAGADAGIPRPAFARRRSASPRWRTASRSCATSPTRSARSPKAGRGRTA